MTERVNLVDAYDNRSVVAKLVSMEERISGAETSVEASAEAAATSASKAAVSQAAAKTSEANAKASADTAAATLSNTVDLSSKQTITGAKTFAGDTTVTGQLISSGTNTLSGTTELEGTVELDSAAVATLNGKVTASNTGNTIKVANHDTVLTSNDVLSAKDINTPNGNGNNLLHRSGKAERCSTWIQFANIPCLHQKTFLSNSIGKQWIKCFSFPFNLNYNDGIFDVEFFTGHSYGGRGKTTLEILRRNSANFCIVKDCCNPEFVVGRLPTANEDGACLINDGTNITLYIYSEANRIAYRVIFASIISAWDNPDTDFPEYNPGCCTRNAFDNYVTIYDESVTSLPSEYVTITYPKIITPKS